MADPPSSGSDARGSERRAGGRARRGRAARRPLLVAAWVVVLAASGLPRVVLQELLHVEVDDDARSLMAGAVVGLGLVVAAAWARLRPLLPFLVLLGVLVGAEWLVYRVVDQAPVFRRWLADPSSTLL